MEIDPSPGHHGVVGTGPWFSFHDDVFTVPEGAVELARSPLCPQAFRAGRSLGVQFHPEFTPAMLTGWLDERETALKEQGDAALDRAAGTETTERLAPAAAEAAYQLFDSFVRAALD